MTPGKINSVGPKLGEHTKEIVDELNDTR
jgi:hypothetical protein